MNNNVIPEKTTVLNDLFHFILGLLFEYVPGDWVSEIREGGR
jgi:hypothetical protein